ncbi:MAG: sigma-54-dependent Fis family transcriptional regulator [Bradymonadales bacterium]|nr:sigma-54-dependent Fis family transcriptional regulator [Bradymonadales bacterium]
MQPTILLVEDDTSHLEALVRVFAHENLATDCAHSGEEALRMVGAKQYDLIIADLMMPGMSGLDLLKAVRALSPETEVIVMTAFGTIELAVDAMRAGAYDFISKPIKRAQILKAARRALEKQALLAENRSLKAQLAALSLEQQIIGNAPSLRRAQTLLRQAAPSSATVLLQGESGTGKELFARTLHLLSPRRDGPFVAIDCAALPNSIVESELFGYERGAFTGADRRKIGRLVTAEGGTLFLDEVGELDSEIQAKLLRVLQEAEVLPLAATTPIKVDIRVVAASHRDLEAAIAAGSFREDLFYRLNVVAIPIPPLRERRDDIPLLAQHFLARFNQRNRKQIQGFTADALQTLSAYHWPGNVRQLANVVERAVVLSTDDLIGLDDLPEPIATTESVPRTISVPLGVTLKEAERRIIEETLHFTGGNKRLAAQILGIAARTIYRKL